jgi:hypothetical protein
MYSKIRTLFFDPFSMPLHPSPEPWPEVNAGHWNIQDGRAKNRGHRTRSAAEKAAKGMTICLGIPDKSARDGKKTWKRPFILVFGAEREIRVLRNPHHLFGPIRTVRSITP